ncbi:unnamed protein product [Polarella glacialis]|uniref:Uncharacterized protein n=1 Tax=Polarella glacialis TaxID=89957 RepID=A0A813HWU1_POLGL|nr:unnamed protein product [Polarella glacialis]
MEAHGTRGRLASGALPVSSDRGGVANATSLAPSWDWQRELEVFAGRLARTRAEEAASARRAAEEAERLALRRCDDVERRALTSQAEESAALQNFLCSWHGCLEVRLENVSVQADGMERRLEQERERSESSSLRLEEVVSTRFGGLEAEIQAAMEQALTNFVVKADWEAFRQQSSADFESHKREVQLDVASREADARKELSSARTDLSSLHTRFGEVEARNEAAARGLGALEPFVERVTERLDHLERILTPALDDLRSELSASSQIQRAAIAAEAQRAEERLAAVREALAELTQQQALSEQKLPDLVRNVLSEQKLPDLVREESQSAAARALQAAKVHADSLERGTESRIQELSSSLEAQIGTIEVSLKESGRFAAHADALEQKLERLEGSFAESAKLASSNIRSSDERLESLRRELQLVARSSADEDARQEAASAARAAQLQELRALAFQEATKLNVLSEQCHSLVEEFSRLKGEVVSHEWRIPRCLQRLRYLSLSTEPGLWLDSEAFELGGVGPLELRLFAKGLRGGDGQCALVLRLSAEAALSMTALPMQVDLAVGTRMRRATQQADPEGGGIMWVAESLGELEEHTGGSDTSQLELVLRAELPLLGASGAVSVGKGSSGAAREHDAIDAITSSVRSGGRDRVPPGISAAQMPMPSTGELQQLPAPRTPARDARGVPANAVPARLSSQLEPGAMGSANVATASAGSGDVAPSGVFALRAAWGTPTQLPVPVVGKVTNPFDEQFLSSSGVQQTALRSPK